MSIITDIFESHDFELIKEIEKQSPLLSPKFSNSLAFKRFFGQLEAHITKTVNEKKPQDNAEFLSLLDEVQKEINKQLMYEGKDMITESKTFVVGTKAAFAMGFGVGALIAGVAVYCYVDRQNKKKRENEASNSSILDKGRGLLEQGLTGAGKETIPVPPSYKLHNLLLVMPANRLPENLVMGGISNDRINDLIVSAVRACCFAVDDEKGNQVMNAVECSETQIDLTTENRVFVQLRLSAQSDITTQRNKLTIREMIEPNSNGEVLQIKNLKSARSASDSTGFYKI